MTDVIVGHTSDDCCIFSVFCVDDGSPTFPGSFVCLKHCCCVHGVTLTQNVTNLVVAGFREQDLSLGVLSSGNQEDRENHQTPGDEPKRHVDCQNELCCCVHNCRFALNCIVIQMQQAKDIGIPDDGEHERSCGISR